MDININTDTDIATYIINRPNPWLRLNIIRMLSPVLDVLTSSEKIFLNIRNICDPQVFLGAVLYIRKNIYFQKKFIKIFDPRTRGSEKAIPPIIWRKLKIILEGCFIA